MASSPSLLFTTKPSLSTPLLFNSHSQFTSSTFKLHKTTPLPKPPHSLSDPFVLQIAETLEDSLSLTPSTPLQKLRDDSSESLLSTRWPTRKDELFRFTDISFIKLSKILPVSKTRQRTHLFDEITDTQLPNKLPVSKNGQRTDLLDEITDTQLPNLVFIDGFVEEEQTRLPDLPERVFVGFLSSLEPGSEVLEKVKFLVSGFEGDLFSCLNGVGADDLFIVYVPELCKVEVPLWIKYYSVEGGEVGFKELVLSNPRVLIVVEKGGEIGVVEEYVYGGNGNKCYWTNSVTQFVLGDGAKVKHSYVQNQSLNAAHFKWTSVQQESSSTYELVEVSTGGKLSRHNLHVQQLGPNTITELSTFHLSLNDQTQDLHSKLVLDHPGGFTRQLHKCIVAHSSGQAVFDGNVQVNRFAQKTDAGQLTRSLLLEPRATVNVKPNLQIIADDVKCSHGATISDLEEDQLFYFQARGVDLETARKALLFSFGAEVIQRLPYNFLKNKVEKQIKELLNPATQGSL